MILGLRQEIDLTVMFEQARISQVIIFLERKIWSAARTTAVDGDERNYCFA